MALFCRRPSCPRLQTFDPWNAGIETKIPSGWSIDQQSLASSPALEPFPRLHDVAARGQNRPARAAPFDLLDLA